jgi:hypothetical protein
MEIYKLETDGILLYKTKFFVPNVQCLKQMILQEMHNITYGGHLGYQKTVAEVKSHYFWLGMKREIA